MTEAFKHIKERPVDPIGSPPTAGNSYSNTSNAYDCAFSGLPFFFAISEKYPYKRETAQYRKQQFDSQKEPGEQTLTGWWLRSQSSFHYGAGIRFQEPVQGETVPYRFNKSAGVDVFNTGKVTLLPKTTTPYYSGNANIYLESFTYSGYSYILASDGHGLSVLNDNGNYILEIDYGDSAWILDIAVDGQNWYVANTNGIWSGPLSDPSVTGTLVFDYPTLMTGTVNHVNMNWVKQRLIAGINNFLFEITPISSFNVVGAELFATKATIKTEAPHNFVVGSLVNIAGTTTSFDGSWQITEVLNNTSFSFNMVGTDANVTAITGTVELALNNDLPIYSHPNSAWIWTGIAEGPNAIYAAGFTRDPDGTYNGTKSSAYRLSLDTTGNVPLLNKTVTAADMPTGEYITSLASYVGKYMVFGTNKGVRVGQIDTSGFISSGYITYGPLTVVTNGYDPASGTMLDGLPVNNIIFNDRYAYCSVDNYIDNGDGTFSSGLVKLDLAKEIAPNQVAYATHLRAWNDDLAVPAYSTGNISGLTVLGNSNKLVLAVAGEGVFFETDNLENSGYIQTGYIRYLTLEDKHFKLIKPRIQSPVLGNVAISSVDTAGTVSSIYTVSSGYDLTEDITTNLDQPTESVAFRFTLFPDEYNGPGSASVLNGYQLKALPAVKRNRSYSVPILVFDFEGDRYNMMTGYEGRAIERLSSLETMEALGDVVIYQDFTSGEEVQGVIESLQFVRMTPPERRFKGFGGVCYVTFRTV